jgi:hypothetical protein
MDRREIFDGSVIPDLKLRSPANWTATVFLGALGGLHLCIATHAFWFGRWEGFLSLIFGCVFVLAAFACALVRSELGVFKGDEEIRLSTGIGRLRCVRVIPFEQIRNVRLTLLNQRHISDSRIEIVCKGEVIECPPTNVPRQEALCLAMLMKVRLVKVYGYDFPDVSERLDKMTSA